MLYTYVTPLVLSPTRDNLYLLANQGLPRILSRQSAVVTEEVFRVPFFLQSC
jgi:hypothetical protein